jgi:hypothetical protein
VWATICAKQATAWYKPRLIRLHISAAAIAPANVGCGDDPLEFVRREVVGWDLHDLDLPETDGGILGEVAASYAGPKEPNHAALLFLLGEVAVFPGVAEVQQSVQLQFIQVFDPGDARPDKKLFAEDGFEFFEGRGFDAAADGTARYASTACATVTLGRGLGMRGSGTSVRDAGGGSPGVGIGGAEPAATACRKAAGL